MHGANATGRPFTGDYAGLLLYETLCEFGYSNQLLSESLQDGLTLKNCRITRRQMPASAAFGHNRQHSLDHGQFLVDSYHTSRYNIQTKRLTKAMFNEVFMTIGQLIKDKV
jgi:uracil-DNA glycosylase